MITNIYFLLLFLFFCSAHSASSDGEIDAEGEIKRIMGEGH